MPPDTRPDRRRRSDRLRNHRREMEFAHAEGCSLLEARQRIAQAEADRRWQSTETRLAARARARALSRDPEPAEPPRWMLAD
jgi:hypothetical protein